MAADPDPVDVALNVKLATILPCRRTLGGMECVSDDVCPNCSARLAVLPLLRDMHTVMVADELVKKAQAEAVERVKEESFIRWQAKERHRSLAEAAEQRASAAEALSVERCLCAAVRTADGSIIRGHRHDDALMTAGKKGLNMAACEQGFLTSRGRFVDRREGMAIQVAAGIESVTGYRGEILFSEDLY